MKRIKQLVLYVFLMVVSCMTACSTSELNQKSITPVSKEQAVSVAEDFIYSVQRFDAKNILELSNGISDSNYEYIDSFDFNLNYGDASADVYKAYCDRITFDINEDEVVVSGSKATVPVTFRYVDSYSLEPAGSDAQSWIDAIYSSENFETTDVVVELDSLFKPESSEAELLVTNADKLISRYYYDEVVNVYFFVDTYVFYDNAIKNFYWAKDAFEATDSISFSFECSEDSRPNGQEISITLFDSSMNNIYETSFSYYSGCIYGYSFSPRNINLNHFEEGFYTVTLSNEDESIYYNNAVFVNEYDPNLSTVEIVSYDVYDGLLGGESYTYSKPSEEILGWYDEETNEYTNEYFGIKFSTSENVKNEYELTVYNLIKNRPASTNMVLIPTDNTMMIINASVINIGTSINSRADLDAFLEDNGGLIYSGIPEVFGERTLYVAYSLNNNATYYFISREENLFVLIFAGKDLVKARTVISTFEFI